MYVITNRKIHSERSNLDIFGKNPNENGPNELRLLKVSSANRGNAKVDLVENELQKDLVVNLKNQYKLDIDVTKKWYASLKVACDLFAEARRKKRNILFYVHGYNNDVGDIIKTCSFIEKTYNIVVIAFSWPANGGGISGYPAYLSDKRDARSSADALARAIDKVGFYHKLLTDGLTKKLQKKACLGSEDNPLATQINYSKLVDRECKTSLNMMCHSMGNYVLKYALYPSNSPAKKLVFDNISLVAADTNNKAHSQWTDKLQFRNRLYIVINEKDFALKWSRRKPGKEQLARLGHYLKNLNSDSATYINVTTASWVKSNHDYFVGDPVNENATLQKIFHGLFEGISVEHSLKYKPEGNYYELK